MCIQQWGCLLLQTKEPSRVSCWVQSLIFINIIDHQEQLPLPVDETNMNANDKAKREWAAFRPDIPYANFSALIAALADRLPPPGSSGFVPHGDWTPQQEQQLRCLLAGAVGK